MKRWAAVQQTILYAAAGLVAVYLIWLLSGSPGMAQQGAGLLFTVLLRSAAALDIMRIVFETDDDRLKTAWRLLAVALVLFAFSDGMTALGFAASGEVPPIPSLSDLVRMAGLLAALAMFVSYPVAPPERFGRIRELLDVAILVLAASTLAYLILVRPVVELGIAESPQIFWLSTAPLADLSLLLLMSRLILRLPERSGRWTIRLLGLAFFAYFVGDLSVGYDLIRVGAGQHGFRYASLMAGSVLIMLASRRWFQGDEQGMHFTRIEHLRSILAPRLEPLLPIAVTYVVVGYILFDWWYSQQVNWAAVSMAAILSVLLVSRQGVVMGQFEMRQFAALVQSTADGAFVCDPGGQIRLANPALLSLLHRSEDPDLLHLSSLIHPGEDIEDILHGGQEDGWVGETRLIDSEGEAVHVSLSLMPVHDRGGNVQLLAGTAHDLTGIRDREDALREALDELAEAHLHLEAMNRALEEKVSDRTRDLQDTVEELQRLNIELQSLDRMKSEFVALVSHELRAPLTTIRSGMELINETTPDLNESVRQRLRVVEEETIRLAGFVEAILDLSALDAGRFPLEIYHIPLKSVLERVIRRMSEPDLESRVVLDLADDLPDVIADERALESVLFHLLDNAIKYAPDSDIEVEGWLAEGLVYTSVTDHGEGIPHEERERAFEMFQRLDTSDTREVYGHGLGLHMARRFLEAMEGGIKAEEPEHAGTRIVFWLPADDQQRPDEGRDRVKGG